MTIKTDDEHFVIAPVQDYDDRLVCPRCNSDEEGNIWPGCANWDSVNLTQFTHEETCKRYRRTEGVCVACTFDMLMASLGTSDL